MKFFSLAYNVLFVDRQDVIFCCTTQELSFYEIIIIIMGIYNGILKCYFSGEHITLSLYKTKQKTTTMWT